MVMLLDDAQSSRANEKRDLHRSITSHSHSAQRITLTRTPLQAQKNAHSTHCTRSNNTRECNDAPATNQRSSIESVLKSIAHHRSTHHHATSLILVACLLVACSPPPLFSYVSTVLIVMSDSGIGSLVFEKKAKTKKSTAAPKKRKATAAAVDQVDEDESVPSPEVEVEEDSIEDE